jgi:hypothetical protein
MTEQIHKRLTGEQVLFFGLIRPNFSNYSDLFILRRPEGGAIAPLPSDNFR